MYILQSVEILGLWACHALNITFNEDVNFLIGPNGSGKTTIIDIIAATLTGNRRSILRLPFQSCTICLSEPGTLHSAVLKVSKEKGPSESRVTYELRVPAQEDRQFVLTEPPTLAYLPFREKMKDKSLELDLAGAITELIDARWLSASRAALPRAAEKDHETTIDVKLDEIRNRFIRYAGRLSNKSNKPLLRLIETTFESLTIPPDFSTALSLLKCDLAQEKLIISNIFKNIVWISSRYNERDIDKLFEFLQSATHKHRDSAPLTPDEIGAIFALARLRTLEEEWTSMEQEKSNILNPLTQFFSVLNSLFVNKTLTRNDSNEISAELPNRGVLDVMQLSSGEKQMIILLGEALLQEGKATVYLADEPELSLHIEWQEKLVSSIRDLNPRAQLVFATHSPDIVNRYDDRVIRIAEAVRQC